MPEAPQEDASTGQAPNAATPPPAAPDGSQERQPAQDGGNGQPTGATPPATLEEALDRLNRLEPELQKVRAEAADRRTRLRELEQADEKRRREGMSETERMTAELTELRETNTALTAGIADRDFTDAAIDVATLLNFRNPRLAASLIPPAKRGDLVAADGAPNRDALADTLRDVLKAEPYLGQAGGADGGEGRGTQPPASTMNDRIRRAARPN